MSELLMLNISCRGSSFLWRKSRSFTVGPHRPPTTHETRVKVCTWERRAQGAASARFPRLRVVCMEGFAGRGGGAGDGGVASQAVRVGQSGERMAMGRMADAVACEKVSGCGGVRRCMRVLPPAAAAAGAAAAVGAATVELTMGVLLELPQELPLQPSCSPPLQPCVQSIHKQ